MLNKNLFTMMTIMLGIMFVGAFTACRSPTVPGGDNPENPGDTTYQVTFDANGGSGNPPAVLTVNAGSSVPLPDGTDLAKSGFSFGGWNTNAGGTGTNYAAGSSYTPTGDVTLYARWNADQAGTFTVTFNVNGGSGTTPIAQTASSGSSITLPSGSGLTKTGYTFGGWNTNSSGMGTNYAAGSSYTITGAITLYARWDVAVSLDRIEYYWVDEHGNLATTSGGTVTVPPGGTLTITAQAAGYTVQQWHLDGIDIGESGNTYAFSSPVSGKYVVGLFVEKDGRFYNTNITVTVVVPYTVTFNANGATSGTPPDPLTQGAGFSITLPGAGNLTKANYNFGGWNTRADGTGTAYNADSSYTVTGDITLYAMWVTTYTVTFNANGGSGTVPASRTVAPGSRITLPGAGNLTKTGYNFGGWTANILLGPNYNAGASFTPTSNITLYARWTTPRDVHIRMSDRGGVKWDGALAIYVNGVYREEVRYVNIADSYKEYVFNTGDNVVLRWRVGQGEWGANTRQENHAFTVTVYYNNGGITSGEEVVSKDYGDMTDLGNNDFVDSFIVQ